VFNFYEIEAIVCLCKKEVIQEAPEDKTWL